MFSVFLQLPVFANKIEPSKPAATINQNETNSSDDWINNINKLYAEGKFEDILIILEPRAEHGDAVAQLNIGRIYYNGWGGIPKDYTKAFMWYMKAAEQGIARAQSYVAYMYEEGLGVSPDYKEAIKWYSKAAENEFPPAQFDLGLMYFNGLGYTKDDSKALYWFKKAAHNGHIIAMNTVGYLYEEGKGVPTDYKEAVKYYSDAAEKGYYLSQSNLGRMYKDGLGVPQDYVAAYMWFTLAAEQGNEWSFKQKETIGKKMNKQDIDKALEMSWKYRPEENMKDDEPDIKSSSKQQLNPALFLPPFF